MPASPVNVLVKLSPTRKRMAKSMKKLIQIISNSDAKLYAKNPPKVFLPIFPTDNAPLMAAILLISDRLTAVLNPER